MALPILYSFRRCPYAIRARLALRQAQIEVELREVVLGAKPEAMLAASPKGTVPVLVLDGGQVIDQSLDIMHWALRRNDPAHWLHTAESPESRQLLAMNDGDFKALLDRHKYPERFPQCAQRGDPRDEAVARFLQPLDRRLRRSGGHLLGEMPSLVDAAIVPFIRQFAQVDADWFAQAALPGLQNWLTRWIDSALFVSVMHKHPHGNRGRRSACFEPAASHWHAWGL